MGKELLRTGLEDYETVFRLQKEYFDKLSGHAKGELLFGRPIRWLLFLYGGRVVPFTIARMSGASSPRVQDVTSGAVTYGHRFLAGRSVLGVALALLVSRRARRRAWPDVAGARLP